jgi:mono/diheme cytochrome c family protein
MTRKPEGRSGAVRWGLPALVIIALGGLAGWATRDAGVSVRVALSDELQQQVLRGRELTLSHGCGDCHGGMPDRPAKARRTTGPPRSCPR